MSNPSVFTELALGAPLLQALEVLAYTQLTPVQAASLPPLLAGRDVVGQARTGSGKTVAFSLALLSRVEPSEVRVQALVLCPTRELADQVSKEIRRLARFLPNVKVLTLCGGVPLRPHVASLAHAPHVVVGTPGRILELLEGQHLSLGAVKVLVLDEADRLLDMGFEKQITEVVTHVPKSRQTLLFSATFDAAVRALSRSLQRDPLDVTVDTTHAQIEQRFHEVDPARKLDALVAVLLEQRPESALVFCNTRREVQEVAAKLDERGHSVLALHGDLDQREREEMLVRFANRSCAVLVATDVAARGLDIEGLPVVVSYDLATDADAHTHRIGRTGRAGAPGLALSLVAPSEVHRVAAIEAQLGTRVAWVKMPPASADRTPLAAAMTTLCIDAGRQDKLRPGDILGALTGTDGLAADAVGKIDTFATRSYVAIRRDLANKALTRLRERKIKGRAFRVRKLG